VQHLTVPRTVEINDDDGERPLEFLFSDHGADIYSAVRFQHADPLAWINSNGMKIIVVFQDEGARQQAIANVRQSNNITAPFPGLEKLKFAVVHLKSESRFDYEKLLTVRWYINDVQYYAPDSCVSFPTRLCMKDSEQVVPCEIPILHAADGDRNWIMATDGGFPNNATLAALYRDPQYVKIIEAMQAKLKEFIPRNRPEAPLETTMGSSQPGPFEAYAAGLIETYAPCAKATQHLQVPEDIHLAKVYEGPSELLQKFIFMFSQDGVDVYAVRARKSSPVWNTGTNKWGPPEYRWSALLVFQEEKARREYLKSFIGAGSISWFPSYNNQSQQDWKPVMSLKHAMFDYGWLGDSQSPKSHPVLENTAFYAPLECYSHAPSPNTLASSEIGDSTGSTPMLDPRNGLLYRAAVELAKLQTQKPDREKQKSH
jgi:hypothetical protein